MDDEANLEEQSQEKEEKSISSDLIRGHINTIILRALYEGDKYGYEIIAEIERKSHGQYSLKQPSLYSALKRLEKDGYVTSYWGGSVAGGRRKYFSLTDEGKAISEQNQSEWEYSRTVIDSLISDKDFDFSNPAPTAVNMRVLRNSTSRVPSREGEDDELEYEPSFDDTLDRERLNAEFAQKNAELEEKQRALETEKLRFEEEIKARNEAIASERDWREKELSERERVIREEREHLETLRSEQLRGAAASQAARDAERAAEYAQLEERMRRLDEEETARREALDAEETMRRRLLEEEETAKKAEMEALETESRRILDEELAKRKAELEAEDAERKRIFEEAEARRKDLEEVNAERMRAQEEQIKERETKLNERETFYNEERGRFAELLRQRDEQIEAERHAHVVELEEQARKIKEEQEELFRQREQQLLHNNYLKLVNSPAQPRETEEYTYYNSAADDRETQSPPPEQPLSGSADPNYRTVVQRIYAGAVQPDREPARARSLDGIDFQDLESRAAHDGIRVSTTGGTPLKEKHEYATNTVHKGKALFLSAIVLFVICVIEGSIALSVRRSYGLPLFYPYLIWAIGLTVLLVTGLLYANHCGERSIRRKGPALINAIVIYALCVIVTLIVALSVKIDFSSKTDLATFIVVPIIFFFGVVVFGICYYLMTKPKKK